MAVTDFYKIQVDVVGNKELQTFQKQVDQLNKSAAASAKSTAAMGKSVDGIKSKVSGITTAMKGLAAAFLLREGLDTITTYQDLKTTLGTLEGSAEAGEAAFKRLQKQVQETPFQIEKLTESYIKLQSAGVEGANEKLSLFSDVASVTNDTVGTLQATTDLFSRSVSGGLGLEDLNRLADRGIPVFKQLEEQLGLSRLEVSEFGKSAEGAAEITAALTKAWEEAYGGASKKKLNDLSVAMSNFGGAIKDTLDLVVTSLGGQNGLAGTLRGLSQAVLKFGEGFKSLAEDFKPFAEAISNTVKESDAAKIALGTIAAALALAFAPVTVIAGSVVALIAYWPELSAAVSKAVEEIRLTLSNFADSIDDTGARISAAWTGVVEKIRLRLSNLADFIDDTGERISAAWTGAVEEIRLKLSNLADSLDGLRDSFIQIGKDLVDGLIQGIKDRLAALKATAVGLGTNLTTWVKDTLGIKSPSRVMMEVGRNVAEGLIIGMDELENMTSSGFESFFTSIIDQTATVEDAFQTMLADIASQIAKFMVSAAVQQLTGFLGQALGGGTFGNTVGGIVGSVAQAAVPVLTSPRASTASARSTGYSSGGYSSGSSGSDGLVNVNVINNNGSDVQTQESTNADGTRQIDVYIEQKVGDMFSSGQMDRSMQSSYGLRRRPG